MRAMSLRLLGLVVAAVAIAALAGCGTRHNTVTDGDDAHLMLRGNDPVAYRTEGRPLRGDPRIRSVHDGVVYRFASEDNKRTFDAAPDRFAPAYAGFCASGAPYALKANIGADVFTIHGDRLYLFGSERSRAHWLMDADRNVQLGDDYWARETRDMPYRLQNARRYTFRVPHYRSDAELDAEYLRRFGRLPPGAPPRP
jgi:hypothetical protein